MKKSAGSRLKVFPSSADVKRFRAQSSKQAGQGKSTEPKVHRLWTRLLLLELCNHKKCVSLYQLLQIRTFSVVGRHVFQVSLSF